MGITLLFQPWITAIACLGMADAATLLRLLLSLGTVSSLTMAAVASGMGARRIWSERNVARHPLAWLRIAAMGAVLLVFAWNLGLALRVWTRLRSVG